MKRILLGMAFGAALGMLLIVSLPAAGAPKPLPTPKLGVPVIVSQDVPVDGTSGNKVVRRDCPSGHVAFGPSGYTIDPNSPQGDILPNASNDFQAKAVVNAENHAIGYIFQGNTNGFAVDLRFQMSCAPVV
jgi:hypothetical protein